jgi:LPS export ABC transporter protein LptC
MKNRLLIQRILLAVAVLAVVATVAIFIGYRRMTQDPKILMDRIQKQADMHLEKIRQTATKNGIREWRMEAESASLLKEKETVLLIKPEVEFFMEDGDNVHLTAEKGEIFTDSNRLNVSGKVVANTRDYRFNTELLKYDPARRELLADTPVTLSGQAFTLQANSMAMNLGTKITRFEGGVEGIISEYFQL